MPVVVVVVLVTESLLQIQPAAKVVEAPEVFKHLAPTVQ
jgi:hypothetical protein